jgi:hypothetical protein
MDIAGINDENLDISDLINIINRPFAANARCCIEARLSSGSKTR